jgi:hypothetical protein
LLERYAGDVPIADPATSPSLDHAQLVGCLERLDAEQLGGASAGLERLRDVPFNAAVKEVVFRSRMECIRALPALTVRMRLLALAPSGERLVGEYTFHHTPYRSRVSTMRGERGERFRVDPRFVAEFPQHISAGLNLSSTESTYSNHGSLRTAN